MPLGSIISAGASLIGGLLGQNEQQKAAEDAQRRATRQATEARRISLLDRQNQREYLNRVAARDRDFAREQATTAYDRNVEMAKNYVKYIAEGARAAGIHPTAALGASPGYVGAGSVVQSPTAAQTASYDPPTIIPGQPRTGSAIGDGLMVAAQAFQGIERSALENDLLRAQTEQARAGTLAMLTRAQSRTMVNPNAGFDFTPVRAFGGDINPSRAFSDVEQGAQRYGEPYEWAAFLPTLAADLWGTAREATHRDVARRGAVPYEAMPSNPNRRY